MSLLSLFAFGALLGFSLTVPPGPMNALIAARAANSWRAGWLTGLGALTADGILGAVVYAFQSVVDLSAYIRAIYAVGSLVMAVVAFLILRPHPRSEPPAPSNATAYGQGVVTGLSNPFQIVWWLTAGIGFAYVGGAPLFAGLFGAILVWVIVFPWAVRTGTEHYPSAEPWIRIGFGALLAAFAAYFALLAAGVSI